MDETLKQVGELLLGSIPTIILTVLLFALYNVLVHKPLGKVLAERRSKTEGAVEKARADVLAAENRTAEYEQRLREARAALYKKQDERRKQALQARAAVLEGARSKAHSRVQVAKEDIDNDKVSAKQGLEAESARLASEIIRTILQPAQPPQSSAGGGR